MLATVASMDLGLQIIGGGKMGEALLGGLIASGWARPDQLGVVEVDPQRAADVAARFPGVAVGQEPWHSVPAIVAVKPAVVDTVAAELGRRGCPRLLSIAAGVTIDRLEAAVGAGVPVVRCMPNTPALVGLGMSAVAPGTNADSGDLAWAEAILGSVGRVVVVDEPDLDAVTGLSGSGPAYVFLLAEALIAAGIEQGLSPAVAVALTEQTLLGSASLLVKSDDPPEVLRANVTSPGGTTAAGLAVFERREFRSLVAEVVAAATDRSRELGRPVIGDV